MRAGWLLLLLHGHDLPGLVDSLGDDDIRLRVRAEARIARMGPEVAPEMRRLLDHPDPEVAARARGILERFTVPRIRLGDGRSNVFLKDHPVPLEVWLENLWGNDWVLRPRSLRISVTALELHEKPPLSSGDDPAIFFPEPPEKECALSNADFQTIGPGGRFRAPPTDVRALEIGGLSPGVLEAWPGAFLSRPTLAGLYEITVRYAYDPEDYKRGCLGGCPGHGDPKAPWNLSPPLTLQASARVTLR